MIVLDLLGDDMTTILLGKLEVIGNQIRKLVSRLRSMKYTTQEYREHNHIIYDRTFNVNNTSNEWLKMATRFDDHATFNKFFTLLDLPPVLTTESGHKGRSKDAVACILYKHINNMPYIQPGAIFQVPPYLILCNVM